MPAASLAATRLTEPKTAPSLAASNPPFFPQDFLPSSLSCAHSDIPFTQSLEPFDDFVVPELTPAISSGPNTLYPIVSCTSASFDPPDDDTHILYEQDADHPQVCGRLREHLDKWRSIGASPFVLRIIQHDWIPRDRNEQADYLSKIFDLGDYKLSVSVFQTLHILWGPFTYDHTCIITSASRSVWSRANLTPDCPSPVWTRANLTPDCPSPVWTRANLTPDCPSPVWTRANLTPDCPSPVWTYRCYHLTPRPLCGRVRSYYLTSRPPSGRLRFSNMISTSPVWTRAFLPSALTSPVRTRVSRLPDFTSSVLLIHFHRVDAAIASSRPYPELQDLTDPELRSLASSLPSIIIADRAPSTIKKYVRYFRSWELFAFSKGLPSLPAHGPHLALYLLKLLQASRSAAPLEAVTFAVAWAHRKAGHPSPHTHPLPSQVLQAAKRILARPASEKLPLTPCNIRQLHSLCLIVVGFSGFLRWDDLSQLHVDGVSFCEGYAALFLEKRKNDQFREGHWICIAATDSVSCPVSLLKRFLKSSNSSGHIKLFRRVANHNGNLFLRRDPMSYTWVREKVLAMLSTIGLDSTKYGLHSLRSGGASTAAAMGVSDRLIAHHGGWRSVEAREGYILETKSAVLGVSLSLGL
ncbi:Hypp9761 [Branchiostoma lanceolatum]|uniref:Hypp9761 protein n=1 Tax=Branchiostoma lanceolatum TaxID=7740 RepID=A0A8S4MPP4_BRALA|nr:Hypp9761 [Branchiostoma lanceolatum]